ncbi:hypothetical protein [Deinococcus saxicola]
MKKTVRQQSKPESVSAGLKPDRTNGPALPTLKELLARIRPGQVHGELD